MTKQIDEIEREIEEQIQTFDISILQKATGKYHRLISPDKPEFKYEFKNRDYNFKFDESIFVQGIRFHIPEDVDLKDLEINYKTIYGKNIRIVFSKGKNRFIINEIIDEFILKIPKRIFNKIKVNSLEIKGFKLDDINHLFDSLKKLKEYKNDLTNRENELNDKIKKHEETIASQNKVMEEKEIGLENKVQELNNSISEKNETLENLEIRTKEFNEQIIPKLEATEEKLRNEVDTLTTKKESIIEQQTELSNNVKQLTSTSDQLNSKISEQKNELQKLIEDTNIFATEMAEYINQGNKDIKLYTKLSFLPWLIIAVVTCFIFWGAADLTTVYNKVIVSKDEIDISAIFWTRVPFVIIVVSIIFVCYEISKVFIKNIIHIHKQKRIFTKIGILAKDVADQSILELNLDEQDKFELRTKLKMDLLKSHLKNDIGEDYEYRIKTSLWDYFISHKEKKDKLTMQKEETEKEKE